MRVDYGYKRNGTRACLAAWDVRRTKVHGATERKTGIAPFERLVEKVVSRGAMPFRVPLVFGS